MRMIKLICGQCKKEFLVFFDGLTSYWCPYCGTRVDRSMECGKVKTLDKFCKKKELRTIWKKE